MSNLIKKDGEFESILLIVVYFGRWPIWFPAFLITCERNASINWLIFSDCEAPPSAPLNVQFVKSTLDEIRGLAEEKIKIKVSIPNNRKLCDIRPAYPVIFDDYIQNYDFWGYCDIDVMWGDIRSFYDKTTLKKYDVISSRKGRMAGHLSIIRNIPKTSRAFEEYQEYKDIMESPDHHWFDEKGFSDVIERKIERDGLRVLWDKYRVNFVEAPDELPSILSWLDRYKWNDGKLYSTCENNREIMYLHFMNWKNSLSWCSIDYGDEISSFKINYNSITTNEKPAHNSTN
jgi:hypothetical protein